MVFAATPAGEQKRLADVSPGPMRLPASSKQFIRFHFLTHSKPGETVTASFQWNGSTTAESSKSCRVRLSSDGKVSLATPESMSFCAISPAASIVTGADGTMDATVPIAFSRAGRYRLSVHAPSAGWTSIGDYALDAGVPLHIGIQLLGVTPTQAVLGFTPPFDASDSCQIQVTASKNAAGWDYSNLVPDVDPNIFAGADNADLNDAVNAPGNRGFSMVDGTRAIVIGRRVAEYSPITYRMHSRALQAATPHEAWINCGTASGTIDFSTANIMPGVTYSDPIPADPVRPGDYAYPTLSWTDRSDGAVDPQTGVLIRNVSLPSDGFLNPGFGDWKGFFGSPIPAYPSLNLPSTRVFLPASVPKYLTSWFNLEVSAARPGWQPTDAALTSFLPAALSVSCPLCANTPVTVCLTADGVTCAVDKNMTVDPNAPVDPNTKQRAVLGTTINCTGVCQFPVGDARWHDPTPVLAAWHPNYAPSAANTVLPSFQFDTVKPRITPVSCANSSIVARAKDSGGTYIGAPFNPIWTKGTPLFIDSVRYTLAEVYDENSLQLNESCPASAKTMTADTFGLLISAPVPLTRVTADGWKARLMTSLTSWDAAGDVQSHTNCSRQPVTVKGKKGWHCVLGNSAYWIAADASEALPLGVTGAIYRPDMGQVAYCQSAFWDDGDPNNLFCLFNTLNAAGKHSIAQFTFFGDHVGLDKAQFTSPEGDLNLAYLPVCKTTSPPSPNNCWRITPLNKTGTNTLFVLEDAVRDAAPQAWNSSAFVGAMKDGNVITFVNAKLDDSHQIAVTWLTQDTIGFSSILEYSTPRGSVSLRAVLPSWTALPNAPGASLRWSVMHNASGVPWGPTKVGIYPTYFKGCCSNAGGGPYWSSVVSAAKSSCPPGSASSCASVTIDGQPGVSNPSPYEPINNAKTRKQGFGYLTDIVPGDLMCAPENNDYLGHCSGYIPAGHFEHLRVLTVTTDSDGTLILTLERNVAGTLTMPLTPNQRLFMLPSSCNWAAGLGCTYQSVVWDWANNTVELVSTGGGSHQFTSYDAANKQVINITGAADDERDPLCYASTPYGFSGCYSVFGGKFDPTKSIKSQPATTFMGKLTLGPPFGAGTLTQGVTGVGTGNDIDAHPVGTQFAAAPNSEKIWFVDGRPFNGSNTPMTPPLNPAQDVYRFPMADYYSVISSLEKYKRLPMLASCGLNALREVTQISSQTKYAYCVALNPDDCMPGSGSGDAYLNCPMVRPSAKASNICPYAGFGNYTPEVRDTCLTLTSAYAMGLTQTGFASQTNGIWTMLPADRRLRSGRLLTRGFARYRIIDQYWNPKTTPDGGVLLFRSLFTGGYATRFLMAKLPPFPDVLTDPLDRRGYVATPAVIDPGPDGTTSVKVQFGYDTQFRCMTRPEPCEARADFDETGTATPYYFASEGGPEGWSCDSGACPGTVNLPGVSQRVIYYRPVYQVNGAQVVGSARVAVVPDPVPVPGNN